MAAPSRTVRKPTSPPSALHPARRSAGARINQNYNLHRKSRPEATTSEYNESRQMVSREKTKKIITSESQRGGPPAKRPPENSNKMRPNPERHRTWGKLRGRNDRETAGGRSLKMRHHGVVGGAIPCKLYPQIAPTNNLRGKPSTQKGCKSTRRAIFRRARAKSSRNRRHGSKKQKITNPLLTTRIFGKRQKSKPEQTSLQAPETYTRTRKNHIPRKSVPKHHKFPNFLQNSDDVNRDHGEKQRPGEQTGKQGGPTSRITTGNPIQTR